MSVSSSVNGFGWSALVWAICVGLLWAPLAMAQCSCSCPSGESCPSQCQGCTTVTPNCHCEQVCSDQGCPRDYAQDSYNNDGCTQGFHNYVCTRTDCTAVGTGLCAACVAGNWGPNCTEVCPGAPASICHGVGSCSDGFMGSGLCICNPGYAGASCQLSDAVTCNATGRVLDNGTCECTFPFAGAYCDQCDAASHYFGYPNCQFCVAETTCAEHGTCSAIGTCVCAQGYKGAHCDACDSGYLGYPNCTACLASVTCNSHGTCNGMGTCDCNTGFVGANCAQCGPGRYGGQCDPCPGGASTPCNGHGTCGEGITGLGGCVCQSGYAGSSCQYSDATTCGGRGVALSTGACTCSTGFGGSNCETCGPNYFNFPFCTYCVFTDTCNGHGTCDSNGICVCAINYRPPTCNNCSTDYYNYPTCSQCIASATCSGRGTCNAQGGCNCQPNFAGTPSCSQCTSGYGGPSCNPCPGYPSVCNGHGTCSVGMAGSGLCTCDVGYGGTDCGSPVITSITPANGPTTAQSTSLIIVGAGFGTAGWVNVTGLPALRVCTIVLYTPTRVACSLPQGEGLASPTPGAIGVTVTRANDSRTTDVSYSFRYDAPVISSLSPANGPTTGSYDLNINGLNFGENPQVFVNGVPVTRTGKQDTRITVTMPAGVGQVPVRVVVAGQSNQVTRLFTYDAPTITQVLPLVGTPTSGGVITLTGSNFGSFGVNIVNVTTVSPLGSPQVCVVNATTLTDQRVECTTGPGQGASVAVQLCRAGSCVTSTMSFDGPQIQSVSGCLGSGDSDFVEDCNTGGGNTLLINGLNFGQVLGGTGGPLSVVANMPANTPPPLIRACNGLLLQAQHVQIRCLLPAGVGKNISITVCRGTTQCNTKFVYSYIGPTFIKSTLRAIGRPPVFDAQGNSVVLAPNVTSQQRVGMFGTQFDPMMTATYGPANQETRFPCGNLQYVNSTYFECTTSGGLGKTLHFAVLAGGIPSVVSADYITYPPPVLTNGTLRTWPDGAPTTSYTSTGTQGELIALDGFGFGGNSSIFVLSDVTVTYGPNYQCVVNPATNNTMLVCRTSAGVGSNHAFRVTVSSGANAQTTASNDLYSYPQSAIISGVAGCQNVGSQTRNCPTVGGTIITITGLRFALSAKIVTVGQRVCDNPQNDAAFPQTKITCILPAGTGTDVDVIIQQNNFFSEPVLLVSYMLPSLQSVSGCSDLGNNTVDCNRNGTQIITLTGSNFGGEGVKVIVGGTPCTEVTSLELEKLKHGTVTCRLPKGTGAGRSVTLLQKSGEATRELVTVSFAKCPPGTSAVAYDCPPCRPGTFAAQSGQNLCLDCPAGAYAASSGSVGCALCGPGTISPTTQQSSCQACVAGTASALPGAVVCAPCQAGTFSAFNQSTSCTECDQGRFQGIPSQSKCDACAAGKYSSFFGEPHCSDCPPGFFTGGSGQSNCTACSAGRYSGNGQLSGSSFCVQCPFGQYASTQGQSSCVACNPGQFSDVLGASTCTLCSLGRYAGSTGLQGCSDCLPGEFSGSQGAARCDPCPSGTFSSANASASCLPCPKGSFQGQPGLTFCTNCTAGEAQPSEGQTTCVPCEAGYVATIPGLSSCSPCASGTYSTFQGGSSTCSACPAGSFTPLPGFAQCSSCALGSFAASAGLSVCAPCAAGRFAGVGGSSNCTFCAPGKFSAQSAIVCTSCSTGKYMPSFGSQDCAQCPVGRFQALDGSASCSECPVGYSNAAPGREACTSCLPGQFANVTGQTSCYSCPAGTFSIQTGGVGATGCTRCNPGRFGFAAGLDTCAPCDLGSFASASGSTTCIPCLRGTFADAAARSSCGDCPTGRFVNSPGQRNCFDCDAGTFANATGLSFCYACAVGKAAPSVQSSGCTLCIPGKYNPFDRQPQCLNCDPGSFSDATGATGCSSCQTGRYQNSLGSTTCIPCLMGSYATNNRSAICPPCPQGQFANYTEGVACKSCEPGRYADSLGSVTCPFCPQGKFAQSSSVVTCLDCPQGFASNSMGQTICQQCLPGKYQDGQGSFGCRDCLMGTASNSPGAALCPPCGPGNFANSTGFSQCGSCATGTFQPISGQTACNKCPPGSFNPYAQQDQCALCPPGTYTRNFGQTICTQCEPGRYGKEQNLTACASCEAGYFSGGFAAVQCAACASGLYANATGFTTCSECSPGKYQAFVGQSQCLLCTAGTYATFAQQTVCLKCTPGTEARVNGSDHCTFCEPGYVQNLVGQPSCFACPPGAFADRSGLTTCEFCHPGSSTATYNSSQCTLCPNGHYQFNTGASTCFPCDPGYAAPQGAVGCNFCPFFTAAPLAGTGPLCYRCGGNAFSTDDRTLCVCATGYYAAEPSQAQTKSGIVNADINCVECPRGALCDRPGITWETMYSLDGWWRETNHSLSFYRCLLAVHCGSAQSGQQAGACRGNREGPICATCRLGYRSQTQVSECKECEPDTNTGIGLAVLFCVLLVMGIVVMYFIVLWADQGLIRKMEEEHMREIEWDRFDAELAQSLTDMNNMATTATKVHTTASRHAPNITYKLKIIVGFLQITTNMAFVLDVEWPSTYQAFIQWFSFMNLDFVPWQSVGCVTRIDFFGKFMIVSCVPLAILSAIFVFYMVPSYRHTRQMLSTGTITEEQLRMAHKSTRRKTWKLVLFTLFLLYPGVSSTILSFFVCRNISGYHYLVADFRIQCYTDYWYQYVPLAIVMILVYPVGVAAFFFWMLRRYRSRMTETGVRLEIGFLYLAYQGDSWWFELCDMANKLWITSILRFFPVEYQMPFAIAWVGCFMIFMEIHPPYIRPSDDMLHLLALTEILLLVLAGYILVWANEAMSAATNVVLSALFIFLTLALILVFAYLLVVNVSRILATVNWDQVKNEVRQKVQGKTAEDLAKDAATAEAERQRKEDAFYEMESGSTAKTGEQAEEARRKAKELGKFTPFTNPLYDASFAQKEDKINPMLNPMQGQSDLMSTDGVFGEDRQRVGLLPSNAALTPAGPAGAPSNTTAAIAGLKPKGDKAELFGVDRQRLKLKAVPGAAVPTLQPRKDDDDDDEGQTDTAAAAPTAARTTSFPESGPAKLMLPKRRDDDDDDDDEPRAGLPGLKREESDSQLPPPPAYDSSPATVTSPVAASAMGAGVKAAAPYVSSSSSNAASASSSSASSGGWKTCEECESNVATLRCDECQQTLCNSCSTDLHRAGKRVKHKVKNL